MTELRFFVPGKPQTAGSKRSVPTPAGARVIESGSQKSREAKRSWRGDLRDAAERAKASTAVGAAEWFDQWPQGIEVRFVFVRARPSDHLRSGKHAGCVKEDRSEQRPRTRPDALKLARAAEDALTGVLWRDDSMITSERLDKTYGDQVGLDPRAEGVIVVVREAGRYAGPTLAPRHAVGI